MKDYPALIDIKTNIQTVMVLMGALLSYDVAGNPNIHGNPSSMGFPLGGDSKFKAIQQPDTMDIILTDAEEAINEVEQKLKLYGCGDIITRASSTCLVIGIKCQQTSTAPGQ